MRLAWTDDERSIAWAEAILGDAAPSAGVGTWACRNIPELRAAFDATDEDDLHLSRDIGARIASAAVDSIIMVPPDVRRRGINDGTFMAITPSAARLLRLRSMMLRNDQLDYEARNATRRRVGGYGRRSSPWDSTFKALIASLRCGHGGYVCGLRPCTRQECFERARRRRIASARERVRAVLGYGALASRQPVWLSIKLDFSVPWVPRLTGARIKLKEQEDIFRPTMPSVGARSLLVERMGSAKATQARVCKALAPLMGDVAFYFLETSYLPPPTHAAWRYMPFPHAHVLGSVSAGLTRDDVAKEIMALVQRPLVEVHVTMVRPPPDANAATPLKATADALERYAAKTYSITDVNFDILVDDAYVLEAPRPSDVASVLDDRGLVELLAVEAGMVKLGFDTSGWLYRGSDGARARKAARDGERLYKRLVEDEVQAAAIAARRLGSRT